MMCVKLFYDWEKGEGTGNRSVIDYFAYRRKYKRSYSRKDAVFYITGRGESQRNWEQKLILKSTYN